MITNSDIYISLYYIFNRSFVLFILDVGSSATFRASLRMDFVFEMSNGNEIKLKAGENCWVINQDGKMWQVLHERVNEPVEVPENYLRRL